MEPLSSQALEILDRIDRQADETQHRADTAQNLADQIDQLRQTHTSPGGEIGVEVDAQGHVTDIEFTDAAYRLDPDRLATTVLDTINQARNKAGQQAASLIADTHGPDTTLTRQLTRTYLPEGATDTPTAPPAAPTPWIIRPKQ